MPAVFSYRGLAASSTVRVNVVDELAGAFTPSPGSVTVTVTFAVPPWAPAGNKVMVRTVGERLPRIMEPGGNSLGLSDVALTARLFGVSTSLTVKVTGPTDVPARTIKS